MGLVPPRLLRPRACVDYDAIQWPLGRSGMRGYQPSSPAPEQNPPQGVSGIIPWENYLRPEQALRDYEQITERLDKATNTWRSSNALRFVDWDMYNVWLRYIEALRQVAFEERDPLAPLEDAHALEWGIRAGIITPEEARIHYRYSAPLTYTAREPESASVFSDGIEPCGYDEL